MTRLSAALLVLATALTACKVDSPSPAQPPTIAYQKKGDRELGMDVVNETPSSSFTQNIRRAKDAGANYITFHIGWNLIEPSTPADCTTPGTYVDAGLSAFNSVVPPEGVKLSLSIVPYTTNIKMMPSNLANLSMDNSLVKCRYKKMLDYAFSKITNLELVILIFSNEMEAHPDSMQTAFWPAFWGFFAEASTHAKSLRPGLKVGLSATMEGLIGTSGNPFAQEGYRALNQASDYIVVNFYPKAQDMTVTAPNAIGEDFEKLLNYYTDPSKKIFVQEFGYQSGSINSSSEDKQGEAIRNLFLIWDKHHTRISHIGLVRLNDVSMSAAEKTADDYGLPIGNPMREKFIDYIRTLGLVTFDGKIKKALEQLKLETKLRGW